MSTTNQPVINGNGISQIVSGLKKDGSILWSLPMTDHFDQDGIYRMIYELKNFKGENPYSKTVDLTFSGREIFQSLLKTFDHFMSGYTGSSKDTLFHFRHFCKYGMMVYSYVKIKGHTPNVRKQLRSMNPTLTTKVQKGWLRSDMLMDLVRSYHYFKIDKNFNSVHVEDIESMTDEEIVQYKDSYKGGFDWEKETNLQKLFNNEEEFWEGQKHGFIKFTGFDSDLSNIETLVTSPTQGRS